MNSVTRDFVSQEPRTFSFKMGRVLASSLTGFVAGVVAASIAWLIGAWYISQVQSVPQPSPVVTVPTAALQTPKAIH